MLWVIGQEQPPCPSFLRLKSPDNFDMSDADDDATKEVDNEVQIPNTAASTKKLAHAKRNAKGILSLQKKPRSSSSSISLELVEFSFMRKEQLEEEKHYKIMQISKEERKFKAESEC